MKISGAEALISKMAKAGDPALLERKCKKAVMAGARHLKEAFREHLAGQNVSGRSTHELENSFRIDPVKYDASRGYFTKVHPDGYDSAGQPLPLIANVLEYGRASGEGQYPWQQPTVERETALVDAIMAQTFNNTK